MELRVSSRERHFLLTDTTFKTLHHNHISWIRTLKTFLIISFTPATYKCVLWHGTLFASGPWKLHSSWVKIILRKPRQADVTSRWSTLRMPFRGMGLHQVEKGAWIIESYEYEVKMWPKIGQNFTNKENNLSISLILCNIVNNQIRVSIGNVFDL